MNFTLKNIISVSILSKELFVHFYYILCLLLQFHDSLYFRISLSHVDIIKSIGGMFSESFKRKKLEQLLPKPKTAKNTKNLFDQSLPSTIQCQRISLQTKRLIYEMEQEYIKRYNILIANKKIYMQMIENLATELDWQGITPSKLSNFYKKIRSYQSMEENTQAE